MPASSAATAVGRPAGAGGFTVEDWLALPDDGQRVELVVLEVTEPFAARIDIRSLGA